jgi:hypothetical protein
VIRAPTDELLARGTNLALDELAVRAVEALARDGIPSILLRGPVIARWLYGAAEVRPYLDVDLLVPPHGFVPAERRLRELGLQRMRLEADVHGDRPRHADTWVRRDTGVMVDLHRTIYGARTGHEVVWAELWATTEPMSLLGREVVVPAPAARALLVVLHAAQHGIAGHATRRDLERALGRVPTETWRAAHELARRLDAEAPFAAGLALTPAGLVLAERLPAHGEPTVEATLRAASAPELSLALEWLSRQRHPGVVARVVARKLFPDPAFMREWSTGARRGRVGLALAYVRRLGWLVAQLAPAVRAWRAAVRLATERR